MLYPGRVSGLLLPYRGDSAPHRPACQSGDPELWFAESPKKIEQAKAICAQCPLQQACLDGARQRGEYAGVWGGQLFADGAIIAVKRGRGRPRMPEVA